MFDLYPFIRSLLFRLDPETAHRLTLRLLHACPSFCFAKLPSKPVTVMGLTFDNPIGLAGGFDRHGDHFNALGKLGFGFIEVGTVTPRPQAGQDRPRIFRLPEHFALINRIGFHSKGVDYCVARLKQRTYKGVLGVNIGKNAATPNEKAADDYLACFDKVYPYADYITVNVSSPNTPGLRELQTNADLLDALKTRQTQLNQSTARYVPLVIKIAPDLSSDAIAAIANECLEYEIDGIIATNTTVSRDAVADDPLANERGGLSGAPLMPAATQVLQQLQQHLNNKIPIIGLGGILSGQDAATKFDAGARLIQVYTGLIYRGPRLLREIACQ
jgi:dihydroorotate dehydrogenase